MKSGLKNTLISISLSALLFSCDGDEENSDFTPYSISGTGCSSLVGKWVSADGFHSWEFTETTAIIRTKSSDTAGALQISYLNYTNNGSSITYFITRAAVTGSGGSDYDNPVNPPKGPYTENYSLSDCKMSIGGKNYTKS